MRASKRLCGLRMGTRCKRAGECVRPQCVTSSSSHTAVGCSRERRVRDHEQHEHEGNVRERSYGSKVRGLPTLLLLRAPAPSSRGPPSPPLRDGREAPPPPPLSPLSPPSPPPPRERRAWPLCGVRGPRLALLVRLVGRLQRRVLVGLDRRGVRRGVPPALLLALRPRDGRLLVVRAGLLRHELLDGMSPELLRDDADVRAGGRRVLVVQPWLVGPALRVAVPAKRHALLQL